MDFSFSVVARLELSQLAGAWLLLWPTTVNALLLATDTKTGKLTNAAMKSGMNDGLHTIVGVFEAGTGKRNALDRIVDDVGRSAPRLPSPFAMSTKSLSGTRTWGTRFDSLLSSPPDSTSASRGPSVQTLAPSADVTHPPPHSFSPTKNDDRISHDASVFVGSLPPDVDHAEISQKLTEYLSVYTEINQVKVIRDNRGGACAFVQCKNSESAAQLISTLRDQPPEPFMGRNLRFEQARSLRALLLSYKAPTEVHPDTFIAGTAVAIEPAKAMKLCRRRAAKRVSQITTILFDTKSMTSTRYITVLYNAEACQSDDRSTDGPRRSTAGTQEEGLLFAAASLQYDAQTMHDLASAFGPVEYFKPYQRGEVTDSTHRFPPPHDTDRAPGMDDGCWEAKWEHRDDCMSALMTLRTVPHLSVSWAHNAGSRSGGPQYDPATRSPFSTPSRREHYSSTRTPLHWPSPLGQSGIIGPHTRPIQLTPMRFTMDSIAGTRSANVKGSSSSSSRLPSRPGSGAAFGSSVDTLLDESDGVANYGEWSVAPSNFKTSSSMPSSPTAFRSPQTPRSFLPSLPGHEAPLLPTIPLQDTGRYEVAHLPSLDRRLGARCLSMTKGSTSTTDPVQSTMSEVETAGASVDSDDGDKTPDLVAPSQPPALSMQSLTTAIESMSMARATTLEDPMLLTPDAGSELVTPIGSGFGCPQVFHAIQVEGEDDTSLTHRGEFYAGHKKFDPTTIFIGGMEMFGPNAWDDGRVRTVFGQYGPIENVKFIRPVHKKSAFAFVKYQDTHSSSRAVLREHNRVYEGRQIRVQIRESHPPRTFFRYGGNDRGRYQNQHQHQHQRQRTFRPDFEFHGQGGTVQPSNREFVERPVQIRGSTRTDGSDVFSVQSSSSPVGSIDSRPRTAPNVHTSDPSFVSQTSPLDIPHTPSYPMAPMPSQSTFAYPVNNVGYYASHPWLAHPYQYPMPLPSTYAPGHVIPHQPAPGSHEGNSPSTVTPPAYHWQLTSSKFQQYMPYHAYPVMAPPGPVPNGDKFQASQDAEGEEQRQAPLAPTGFTHGEHGYTPIYPPDALTQYMTTPSYAPSQSMTSDQTVSSSASPMAPGSWPAYTYAYPPVQVPQMVRGYPMATQVPMGWYPPPVSFPMHGVGSHHASAAFMTAPQAAGTQNVNAMFHGMNHMSSGGGARAPRSDAHAGTSERRRSRPYGETNGTAVSLRAEAGIRWWNGAAWMLPDTFYVG
ncbi:hypothetical protein OF83DRAFT_1082036 [Amylostereum chailletii]|nr:hypothetical protein OF83DRAFT_1082036 [Amylostereum chailletii]